MHESEALLHKDTMLAVEQPVISSVYTQSPPH